jgi:hypothetical protein
MQALCKVGNLRLPLWLSLLAVLTLALTTTSPVFAQSGVVDVRTFVTRSYYEGISFRDAASYGVGDVLELSDMLMDETFEEHWGKVVYVIAVIGDPSATTTLLEFFDRLSGEISAHALRASFGVFQGLGHLARNGDEQAMAVLLDFGRPDFDWQRTGNLDFSYGRYGGGVLAEVTSRFALQGLAISGKREALAALNALDADPNLRTDWRDNVEEAITINSRIRNEGPAAVFDGGE